MKQLVIWTLASPEELERFSGLLLEGVRWVRWNRLEVPPASMGSCVLAMGAKPFEVLQEAKVYPKNRVIKSLRSTQVERDGVTYFVSYDVRFANRGNVEAQEWIAWDIQAAARFSKHGTTLPKLGNYKEVDSLERFINRVKTLYKKTGKPVPVAHDLEFVGNSAWDPGSILQTSWCAEEGVARCLYFAPGEMPTVEQRKELEWLFTSPKVSLIGASHKGDEHWLWTRWGMRVTNFKYDVVIVGSLLNENRSNSLNILAKKYTPIGGYDDDFNRTYNKSRMDLVPREACVRYGCADVDATLRVRNTTRALLMANRKLSSLYQHILLPAHKGFVRSEQRGILVDQDEYKRLGLRLDRFMKRKSREFSELIPVKVKSRYKENLKYTRPGLIRDMFFSKIGFGLKPVLLTDKTKKPKTSADHLNRFLTHPRAKKAAGVLYELSRASKTKSTYVVGWLKHLRPDGKFHAFYFLFKGAAQVGTEEKEGGAGTGRTSAKDPSIQTLPKHSVWAKPLRKCLPAPPGKGWLQWDFSQGELRIMACLANEGTMLRAYRRGEDLHTLTAAEVSDTPVEVLKGMAKTDPDRFDLLRFRGKAGNFGLIYDISPEGFVEYARNAYQVVLALQEAEKFHERFFHLYDKIPLYHEHQRDLVKRNKQVRSPLGRIRRLPMVDASDPKIRSKAFRQAINSPTQGALSDLCLWSLGRIEEEYPDADLTVGMTHDSLVAYAPLKELEFWGKAVKVLMENLPIEDTFGWKPQIPFPVDVEYSETTLDRLTKMRV